MKRLIAILLAVMLLGSVEAFADDAAVFTLSDPILSIDRDGQEPVDISLPGLTAAVSPVLEGGNHTVTLNVLMNEEAVLVAAVKNVGEKIYFGMDGLSDTYFLDVPAEKLIAHFDRSGVDLEALFNRFVSEIELTTEESTVCFKIPYTAINDVIDELYPVVKQAAEAQEADFTQVERWLQQFEQNNSGYNLEGTFTPTAYGFELQCSAFRVQNEYALDHPTVSILAAYNNDEVANGFDLTVTYALDGYTMIDVFWLHFDIGHAVPGLTFYWNTFSGIYFGFFYDNDASSIRMDFSTENMTVEFDAQIAETENELIECPLDESFALNARTLSEGQTQQLQDELEQAFAPLIDMIMQAAN